MTSFRSQILHRTLQRITCALDTNFSIQEQRTRVNELARRGIRVPKGVTVCVVRTGGVHAEWVEPAGVDPRRVILYLHGGGYTICSPDTHRGLAARLAQAGGSRVLLIAYRLAPENPFPAALEDALASYRWLLTEGILPANIVIAGDSAGGGLTLATALSLREAGDPLPAALVCLSPWTDLTMSGETIQTMADIDPVLRLRGLPLTKYYTGNHDPAEPLISPLFADLRGLPPLLVHVGSDEILLSDSTRLVEKARQAGVAVSIEIWQGMWHVFQVFAPFVPEAQQSIDKLGNFIRAHTGSSQ